MFLSPSRGECSVVRMDFRKNTVERASARSWLGLVATLGPVLVVAMDGSILFLAIPSINEAIRPSTDQAL